MAGLLYRLWMWYRDANIWIGQCLLRRTSFHIDDQLLYNGQLFHRHSMSTDFVPRVINVPKDEILSLEVLEHDGQSVKTSYTLAEYADLFDLEGQTIDTGLLLLMILFQEGHQTFDLYYKPIVALRTLSLVLYAFNDDGDVDMTYHRLGDKLSIS